MRNYKLFILLTLLLAAVVVLAGCGGKNEAKDTATTPVTGTETTTTNTTEKPVLKIGYLPITHSLPLVVMDKLNQGKTESYQLELVKFSSWPELTEALNSGQIQGAVTMLELALVSAERGLPGEILALSHRNGDAITVSKDINTVKDLKGQRVAIPHRMSGHNILLHQALKNDNLTLDDVQWVEMAPPDMPAALARGDIKGYVVAEPFGGKAVLDGNGKTLLTAKDLWPDWICCALVLNKDLVKTNPAAAQELVDNLVGAGQYIDANQGEAIKIAQEYMTIKGPVWEKSFQEFGITYADLQPKTADLQKLQNYMVELKLLKQAVKLEGLVNDSFVTKAYSK